jgi:predicted nucleotidyltransferase
MGNEISPEKMAVYREAALRRERERQERIAARRQRARALADAAARLLKEEFGATAVILFGSLVHDGRFHERSDVDLAVDGIPPRQFFRAWNAADYLDDEIEVNIVHVDDARPSLRAVIEEEGIPL